MKKTKKTGHPAWTWMAAAAVLGFTEITAGAADPALIEPERKGSIMLTLYDQESGSAVADGVLTLYQVAVLRTEGTEAAYLYTSDFADCTISLADVSQASLAAELDGWINAHAVSGMKEAGPDDGGHVMFSDLPCGLYLIRQTQNATGYEQVLPFLVTVPFSEGETWIYDVDAQPKVKLLSEEPETELETEPETKAETETETETKAETETEIETRAETETETETKAETEAETETETETESETQTETETESETETRAEKPTAPPDATSNGQPRSAKTGDTTPVAATLCLLFAGAAVLVAGLACRHRAHRG